LDREDNKKWWFEDLGRFRGRELGNGDKGRELKCQWRGVISENFDCRTEIFEEIKSDKVMRFNSFFLRPVFPQVVCVLSGSAYPEPTSLEIQKTVSKTWIDITSFV
jgi:hypothetical protein